MTHPWVANVLLLAVLVLCVFLVKQLAFTSKVEDCLMANRSNCDTVVARAR